MGVYFLFSSPLLHLFLRLYYFYCIIDSMKPVLTTPYFYSACTQWMDAATRQLSQNSVLTLREVETLMLAEIKNQRKTFKALLVRTPHVRLSMEDKQQRAVLQQVLQVWVPALRYLQALRQAATSESKYTASKRLSVFLLKMIVRGNVEPVTSSKKHQSSVWSLTPGHQRGALNLVTSFENLFPSLPDLFDSAIQQQPGCKLLSVAGIEDYRILARHQDALKKKIIAAGILSNEEILLLQRLR